MRTKLLLLPELSSAVMCVTLYFSTYSGFHFSRSDWHPDAAGEAVRVMVMTTYNQDLRDPTHQVGSLRVLYQSTVASTTYYSPSPHERRGSSSSRLTSESVFE